MSTQGLSLLYKFDLGNRNLVELGSNILSVTTQAPGDFDKGNLTTESVRHVWRSTDASVWQDIVIKADVKSRIDTFALLGHNLSETAVVRVQANIANNWVAPAIDYAVPWQEKNLVLCRDFIAEYEYYRVRILDPANACGFVQVGRIIGGRATTLTNNEDVTDDIDQGTEDYADQMKSEGFFRVSNERIKADTLNMRLRRIKTLAPDNANFLALMKAFKYCGTTRPLLAIVDRNDTSFVNIWGLFTDIPSRGFTVNRYVDMSVKMMEVF